MTRSIDVCVCMRSLSHTYTETAGQENAHRIELQNLRRTLNETVLQKGQAEASRDQLLRDVRTLKARSAESIVQVAELSSKLQVATQESSHLQQRERELSGQVRSLEAQFRVFFYMHLFCVCVSVGGCMCQSVLRVHRSVCSDLKRYYKFCKLFPKRINSPCVCVQVECVRCIQICVSLVCACYFQCDSLLVRPIALTHCPIYIPFVCTYTHAHTHAHQPFPVCSNL